ncbi:MAG: hypothetical protein PHE67_10485 [Campylobacterales bacterium]|nr:hypothetical protein [Campylobacterales bacterium]
MGPTAFPLDSLRELFKIEAEAVNIAFNKSVKEGLVMLSSSIDSFENLLIMQKGNFVRGVDLDYRIFIEGLLENIDAKYTDHVMSQIIFNRRVLPIVCQWKR